MKSFVKLFLFFIFPLLLGGIGLELLLRQIPNDYQIKGKYLRKHASSVETLVLGSSHSMYGINPEYLDASAYNASFVSQTTDLDLAILEKFMPELSNLKTVIVRLSYATLFETLSETSANWRLKDYIIYFDLNTKSTVLRHSELFSLKLKTNLDRLWDYYVLGNSEIQCYSLGWADNSFLQSPMDLDLASLRAAQRHTISNDDQYVDNVEAFERMAKLCQDNNINLILVTLPGYLSYRDNLDPLQLQKMLDFASQIESNYKNTKYYNFLSDPDFSENDFFDGDHLNAQGAKKITDKLNALLP
ncbi:hypothetical protein [Mangrovimonas xylaniphaga]|uniref:hypothetical protein n=1 Tax=Mangrovimonas xylaniphaga TaxID=1645915 RepID=UPI0006B4EE84|nr:hypothetical protein [Mangrovimonas xylaniphaga]